MVTTGLVGYHGGRNPAECRGRLWVALDPEYAEGYAQHNGGAVYEVPLDGLRILDLTAVRLTEDGEIDSESKLARLLDAAGVETTDLGWGEMHQRIPVLADAIAAAGYDAVMIREWTYGVGETESVCILDYKGA